MSLEPADRERIGEQLDRELTTISLAIRPEIEATVARQLPKPCGMKIQEIALATIARMELS
jgi:hypothetical protein